MFLLSIIDMVKYIIVYLSQVLKWLHNINNVLNQYWLDVEPASYTTIQH